MNKLKLILAFVIPIFFNNLINLSDGFYLNNIQRIIIDIFVLFGVIGIILVQTYGSYKLLEVIKIDLKDKKEAK